jgi:hypothetical protein
VPTTPGHHLEARLIALEMLFRGMLAGIISKAFDPVAEVERMAEEFRSTANCLRVGAGDDHAEHMRGLIVARVDEIFDAIRGRVLRDAEIQAARAGKKN